jgi:hypothetical protein
MLEPLPAVGKYVNEKFVVTQPADHGRVTVVEEEASFGIQRFDGFHIVIS